MLGAYSQFAYQSGKRGRESLPLSALPLNEIEQRSLIWSQRGALHLSFELFFPDPAACQQSRLEVAAK